MHTFKLFFLSLKCSLNQSYFKSHWTVYDYIFSAQFQCILLKIALKSEIKSIKFKCSIDFNIAEMVASQNLVTIHYTDGLLIRQYTRILGKVKYYLFPLFFSASSILSSFFLVLRIQPRSSYSCKHSTTAISSALFFLLRQVHFWIVQVCLELVQ